jgi:aspartyl-tRNA(Asn)/glutamyl-tRNA(Gln) amidotransferase subunit A
MSMYLNDIATIPANLAGIPGMSIPSGLAQEDGLPAGIQILAPAMQDQRLYAVGAALEEALRQAQDGYVFEKAPQIEVTA